MFGLVSTLRQYLLRIFVFIFSWWITISIKPVPHICVFSGNSQITNICRLHFWTSSHYQQFWKCWECIRHQHSSVCAKYILGTCKLVNNRRMPKNVEDKYSLFYYSPRIPDNTRMCIAGLAPAFYSYKMWLYMGTSSYRLHWLRWQRCISWCL